MSPRRGPLPTPKWEDRREWIVRFGWNTTPGIEIKHSMKYHMREEAGAFGTNKPDKNFMTSDDVGVAIEEGELLWDPVRLLGQGGFGKVGLWRQLNDEGATVDEIAVKETESRTAHLQDPHQDYPGLSRTAWINRELNKNDPENFLFLRKFKHYTPKEKVRFYTNFAPHGDLYRLLLLYRLWDEFLPELFLWHLFDALVDACQTMEDPPQADDITLPRHAGETLDEWYMLHFDLKPANILLDYTFNEENETEPQIGGDPVYDYPRIRVNDFDLTSFTSKYDVRRNPTRWWGRGTSGFLAPEQLNVGANWKEPPNGELRLIPNQIPSLINPMGKRQPKPQAQRLQREDSNRDIYFTKALNIWAIGKIMFDMMTLSWSKCMQNFWDNLSEDDYDSEENLIDRLCAAIEIPPYSEALIRLVIMCLRLEADTRPTAADLRETVHEYLAKMKAEILAQREGTGNESIAKLFFRGNEINDMPAGDVGFDISAREKRFIQNPEYQDPDWEPLRVPIGIKWGSSNAPAGPNSEIIPGQAYEPKYSQWPDGQPRPIDTDVFMGKFGKYHARQFRFLDAQCNNLEAAWVDWCTYAELSDANAVFLQLRDAIQFVGKEFGKFAHFQNVLILRRSLRQQMDLTNKLQALVKAAGIWCPAMLRGLEQQKSYVKEHLETLDKLELVQQDFSLYERNENEEALAALNNPGAEEDDDGGSGFKIVFQSSETSDEEDSFPVGPVNLGKRMNLDRGGPGGAKRNKIG